MKRFHLFEIADQDWCPSAIRRGVTAFLATVSSRTGIYRPTIAVIKRLLERAKTSEIIVLCAGSGGGILDVAKVLDSNTKIVLTDIVPDTGLSRNSLTMIYDPRPVDVRRIPADLKGVRVIYGSFHHFRPNDAKAILESAVSAHEPIAIFEATERSVRGLAVSLLIPVLVLGIFWDGLVSSLRSYTQKELLAFVENLKSYEWEVGVLSGPHRERITYLSGIRGKATPRAKGQEPMAATSRPS